MLYFLFLYQMESGELLYEKKFQADIESQMDLFGTFFSALKTFISKVADDTREELKTIGLGALIASIIRIAEVNIDLVLIAEKEDKKEIQKLSSELKDIVIKNNVLFLGDSVNSEDFEVFDRRINAAILSHKKALDPDALIEKQKVYLKSVWEQRGKISDQIREERKKLENERTIIVTNYQNEKNILNKLALCKRVLEISDKLEDEQFFLDYQNKSKNLNKDINDRKLRLNYYLTKVKESLKLSLNALGESQMLSGDFKEVYSNLYSFSSKLKDIAPKEICDKYYQLANKLVYKKGISSEEFSTVIDEINHMNDNIETYFHNYRD